MKEVSRKFSGDSKEPQQPSKTPFLQSVCQPCTAMDDLRFVVKNSFNLGALFLTDVELFYQLPRSKLRGMNSLKR